MYTEKIARDKSRQDIVIKTKSSYIKDRAEERSARYTSRIDIPSLHNNRKMTAWNKSVYAGERLNKNVQLLIGQQLQENWEVKMAIEADMERKKYLQERIKERGPEGYGKRSELPDLELTLVNGFYVGPERIAPRSRSMRSLLQKEVEEITAGVVERAAHDFRGFRLLDRFKEFNSAREGPDAEYLERLVKARENFGATAKVIQQKRKAGTRFRREYKFPNDINVDPLSFLDEDLDKTLEIQDTKQREKEKNIAEDAQLNDRQRAQRAQNQKKIS